MSGSRWGDVGRSLKAKLALVITAILVLAIVLVALFLLREQQELVRVLEEVLVERGELDVEAQRRPDDGQLAGERARDLRLPLQVVAVEVRVVVGVRPEPLVLEDVVEDGARVAPLPAARERLRDHEPRGEPVEVGPLPGPLPDGLLAEVTRLAQATAEEQQVRLRHEASPVPRVRLQERVELRIRLVVRAQEPVRLGAAEPRLDVKGIALQDLPEAEPRLVVVPVAKALLPALEVAAHVVAGLVRREILVLRGRGAEEEEEREELIHPRIVRASFQAASRVV